MNTCLFLFVLLINNVYSLDIGIPVFTPGEGGYPCIRVPAIASTSTGVLVAFAECRKYIGDGCTPTNNINNYNDDSSQRWICQKISNNNGQTWSNLTFPFGLSHTSYNPTIVYDKINSKLVLQSNVFNLLPNQTIYQIESYDDGVSWINTIDIGKQLFPYNQTYASGLWPGPSTGLQLTNKSKKYGRLLWSGHTNQGSYVWFSDDYGKTYSLSKTPFNANNLPFMEEGAVVELSNGSLIDNMRNSHHWSCDCRGFSVSNDFGNSFSDSYPSKQLISPECEGSTISIDIDDKHFIFFSNPDDTSQRVNMTVKKSIDDAENWTDGYHLCEGCGGGYSCLTTLPNNNTHIGLLWETNSSQCIGGPQSWACQTLFSYISVDI